MNNNEFLYGGLSLVLAIIRRFRSRLTPLITSEAADNGGIQIYNANLPSGTSVSPSVWQRQAYVQFSNSRKVLCVLFNTTKTSIYALKNRLITFSRSSSVCYALLVRTLKLDIR